MKQLREALQRLHAVCVAMDAENEATRPTEAEYQAAMNAAASALGVETVDGGRR